MRGFHRTKRNQANLVWLAAFRAPSERIARKSLPPSGDRSKAVMVMVIVKLLLAKIIGWGWHAVKAN